MKFVDLCCGIGAFTEVLEKKGHECVFSCDIDETARQTYEANHKKRPAGDIYKVGIEHIPNFDLLCCGFPCMPFSTIGKRRGLYDLKNGDIFYRLMSIIHFKKPKYFILENVIGLLSLDDGKHFDCMMRHLRSEGYYVDYGVLNCSDYGVPQNRKRVFIIGHLDYPIPVNITPQPTVTLTDYLNKGVFEKSTSYTIRALGGRYAKLGSKHNWTEYKHESGVYKLTLDDVRRLQGLPNDFILKGSIKQQWKQLGNTIPFNLVENVISLLSNGSPRFSVS